MTRKAHDALKSSIAHWRRMATGEQRKGEIPSAKCCALCRNYLEDRGCDGCPVYLKTGERNCDGTPFLKAFRAFKIHGLGSVDFKEIASKELTFLENLLPKKGKK